MKTLFILRHAEAAPDRGGGDYARSLTDRGARMAKDLGAIMAEKNYAPAFVFCSGAERTRQTLDGVMEAARVGKVEYSKDIYHADAEDFIEMVRGLSDEYDSVLVVGHNPTVHQAVAALADDDSPYAEVLMRGYAPGTLSVLSIPETVWKDLKSGKNRLQDLVIVD